MGDMYDLVKNHEEDRKKQKKKRDSIIAILIIVTVLILSVVGYLIFNKVTYQRRFDKFLTYINDSTIYAYDNDSLYVDYGIGQIHVSPDNNFEIYKCMVVYGPGTERSGEKESDGTEAVLNYGDGGILKIWDVKDEDGEHSMYVKYENGNYSHMFSTKFTHASVLISRYSTDEVKGNSKMTK